MVNLRTLYMSDYICFQLQSCGFEKSEQFRLIWEPPQKITSNLRYLVLETIKEEENGGQKMSGLLYEKRPIATAVGLGWQGHHI